MFDYSNSTHKNDNTLSDRFFTSGWSSCCNFYRRISKGSSGHSTTVVNISATVTTGEFRGKRRVYQQRDLTNR